MKPQTTRPTKRRRTTQQQRPLPPIYHIVVQCRDEQHQRIVYNLLQAHHQPCKVVTL